MSNYITIDGGTTNTRVSLVHDKKIITTEKIHLGSKDCIDGNARLKNEIKLKINKILLDNKLCEGDIRAILASGMITSEYGLHEIKHLTAPVGIKELHCAMQKKIINDISGIPFYFIPGVKNDADTPENADMMRGEETELMGLINENSSDYVYVLPGSHSKLILLDEQQRISSFQTMLTGEMISALSQHTILKGTVDLNVSQYDVSSLITGYEYCLNYGINKALFTTRILKNIFNKSDIENYSYFLGVVLANEIEALRKCKKNGVIIGGKSQIKNAMRDILKIKTDFDVICIPDEDVDCCVPIGAIRIFEYKT